MFLVLAGLGAILISNGVYWVFQKIARKYKWKNLQPFFSDKPYGRNMTIGILLALLLVVGIKISLYDSRNQGIEAAREQTHYTIIVGGTNEKQVLIYHHDGIGLFKTFNPNTQSFNKSYTTINLEVLSSKL